MNPIEAGKLLAHCAMFDNRQPSRMANEAWAAALRDLPLDDDALAAVARFYGTPPKEPGARLWIQPHDVRTHRKIIRAERLENFVYEPPDGGGDDDPFFLRRYRQQLDEVASGRRPPNPNAPALEGGPHPKVAEAIAGVGREVPDADGDPEVAKVKRPGPLGVECPKCQAPIGRPCRLPGREGRPGRERATHPARVLAARGVEVDREPEAAEEERRREASRRHLAALRDAAKAADDSDGEAS